MLIRIAAVACAALLTSAHSQAQGLAGSTSTTAVYCCTAPTETYRISNFVEAVVGPGVEVPAGALTPIGGFGVIPVTIDFANSTIQITYTSSASALSGTFNGYLFQFAGAPPISAVSLDPANTFSPVSFGFTENSIWVNVSGLSVASGATGILNVTAVPEVGTMALMLAGLGAMLAVSRRKRQASVEVASFA